MPNRTIPDRPTPDRAAPGRTAPGRPIPDLPETPKLAENIAHFARALRRAGLPIGPGRVLEAIRAVTLAGFTDRRDFYWTLHACFVSRPEHRATFAQVFRLFWRDPRYMERMMSLLLPAMRGTHEERAAKPAEKRAAEALLDTAAPEPRPTPESDDEIGIAADSSATASADERLRRLDFEQMSASEMARAREMVARLE